MRARYTFMMKAVCPIDGKTDTYEVTVESKYMIKIEDILEAANKLPEPAFQEELTQFLAKELGALITTVGTHSGVHTEVVA